MSVKYFCDACMKETDQDSRVCLMGGHNAIKVLCEVCWDKAENWLLSKKQAVIA